MRIIHFPDTDTAHIVFTGKDVHETREISEHFLIDLDSNGDIVSMTIEHAKDRASLWKLSYQEMLGEIV